MAWVKGIIWFLLLMGRHGGAGEHRRGEFHVSAERSDRYVVIPGR